MADFLHRPGFVYVDHERRVVFIPIPKNGSTTIRNLRCFNFQQEQLTPQSLLEYSGYRFFTVLRDPVERFVSSYLEARHRGYNNISMDFIFEENLHKSISGCLEQLNKRIFDPHFQGQGALLEFFESQEVDFLNFTNLDHELKNLLARKYKIEEDIGLGERHKVYSAQHYSFFKTNTFNQFLNLCQLVLTRLTPGARLSVGDRRKLFLLIRSIASRISYYDLMPSRKLVVDIVQANFLEQVQEVYRLDYALISLKGNGEKREGDVFPHLQ